MNEVVVLKAFVAKNLVDEFVGKKWYRHGWSRRGPKRRKEGNRMREKDEWTEKMSKENQEEMWSERKARMMERAIVLVLCWKDLSRRQ